jgi:hypothetical protein
LPDDYIDRIKRIRCFEAIRLAVSRSDQAFRARTAGQTTMSAPNFFKVHFRPKLSVKIKCIYTTAPLKPGRSLYFRRRFNDRSAFFRTPLSAQSIIEMPIRLTEYPGLRLSILAKPAL